MARTLTIGKDQQVTVASDWTDEDIASVYGPEALGATSAQTPGSGGGPAATNGELAEGPSTVDELRKSAGATIGSVALPLLTRGAGGPAITAARQIVASGLGAAGGEGVQEVANQTGVTGDPTRPPKELGQSIAVRFGEGVAFEALAQGVMLSPKVLKVFNPKMTPEAVSANKDLKQYGGHLALDTSSENWLYQQIGGLARGSFTGSGSFKALEKLNTQALEKFETDVADKIGKSMTDVDDYTRGLLVRDILVNGEIGFRSAANGLYGALDDAAKGVRVDFTPARELALNTLANVASRGGLLKSGPVNEVINRMTNLPANVSEEYLRTNIAELKDLRAALKDKHDVPTSLKSNINSLISITETTLKNPKKVEVAGGPAAVQFDASTLRDKAAGIKAKNWAKETEEENVPIQDLLNDVVNLQADMSFSEAAALRSDMLSIKRGLEDAIGKEKANFFVSKFTTAINEQMEIAAKGVSPDFHKSYLKANRFYTRGKETFNNKLIRRLVDDEVPVEQIGKIVARSGNVTAFKDFSQALRKSSALAGDKTVYDKGVASLRAGVLDELFTNSSRDGVINGRMLVNKISNHNMQRTLETVLQPSQYDSLKRFAIAAEMVQKKPEAGLSMIMQLTQASAIVGAATGVLEPGTASVVFGGPYVLAKVMTRNPEMPALLKKAITFSKAGPTQESIKAAIKVGSFMVAADQEASNKRIELNQRRQAAEIEARDMVMKQKQAQPPSSFQGS
jgi:hypothetical protein